MFLSLKYIAEIHGLCCRRASSGKLIEDTERCRKVSWLIGVDVFIIEIYCRDSWTLLQKRIKWKINWLISSRVALRLKYKTVRPFQFHTSKQNSVVFTIKDQLFEREMVVNGYVVRETQESILLLQAFSPALPFRDTERCTLCGKVKVSWLIGVDVFIAEEHQVGN